MAGVAEKTSVTFGEAFLARAQATVPGGGIRGGLCVGMDPHASLLQQWGLDVSVSGLDRFSRICVDAFSDVACVVKPQVAFYEAFGSAGFAILERSIADLRAAGVLVIADAKRGDIGSTMAGYATAWLSPKSPLACDAVTVSPYLGVDALEAVFEVGERHNKGVIVLAATSNPEAPSVQRARVAEPFDPQRGAAGKPVSVAQDVVDRIAARNRPHPTAGNCGVVVGATLADPPELDAVGGVVLMPGVGAQGAAMEDVKRIAGAALPLVSPNVSRAVLQRGPDVSALTAAVEDFSQDLLK